MNEGLSPGRRRVSLLLKIAALTSLPILGIMMAALLVVNHRLADEVNRNVSADLERAALAFRNQMDREGENLERVGVVVARDPKFFALLTLPRADRRDADFAATLLGVARDFQRDAEAPLFDVTDEHGTVLAARRWPGGRPAVMSSRGIVSIVWRWCRSSWTVRWRARFRWVVRSTPRWPSGSRRRRGATWSSS
jgi:hypothetical protein